MLRTLSILGVADSGRGKLRRPYIVEGLQRASFSVNSQQFSDTNVG